MLSTYDVSPNCAFATILALSRPWDMYTHFSILRSLLERVDHIVCELRRNHRHF